MKEPDEICPIEVLLPSGEKVMGEFLLWEESPDDQDEVLLALRFSGREYRESAEGFFDALTKIRKRVEPNGILLNCYGSSRDVFPSPMVRAMGAGRKAYRLKRGVPARSVDLISIFERGTDVQPVTVAEQEKFYQEWLKSLG